MHVAVSMDNLALVKLLDEYGADATIVNNDEVCPIQMAIDEDIKEIKLYFMSQQKYKNYNFNQV
jgi:hypothetical protein